MSLSTVQVYYVSISSIRTSAARERRAISTKGATPPLHTQMGKIKSSYLASWPNIIIVVSLPSFFSDVHPKYGKRGWSMECHNMRSHREKSSEGDLFAFLPSPCLTSIFDVDRHNLFNTWRALSLSLSLALPPSSNRIQIEKAATFK